jgi:hypothetical protein
MKLVTKMTLLLVAVFMTSVATAQDKKPASPPAVAKGTINGANITINYSSPFVKGRAIWGGLVPYGQVWRAGANGATTFETDKAIMVEGKELPAGKYAFFVIPEKDQAVIIFNSDSAQWGAYDHDAAKDQLRVTVKTKKSAQMNESLVYTVNKNNVTLSWENLDIPVAIK